MTETPDTPDDESLPEEIAPGAVGVVDGSVPLPTVTTSTDTEHGSGDAVATDPDSDTAVESSSMTLAALLDQCRKLHFVTGVTVGWFGVILLRSVFVGDPLMAVITGFSVVFGIWVVYRQARVYRDNGWL